MKTRRLVSAVLAALLILSFFAGCGEEASSLTVESEVPVTAVTQTQPTEPAIPEFRDLAGAVKLDMDSETAKQEVTVKSFVDGDTVHFHVPADLIGSEVLKARFVAINTPESTGKIEEFGKKASDFTKGILSGAASIILESETSSWNPDSTGGRYLVWVWYKTKSDADYRNLNIEILQNGLAIANSTATSRYGETAMEALSQAKAHKLNIYSGEPDPDYYYGEAIELTLRELRSGIADYVGRKVAFNGIISTNSGTQGVYVEDYDPETDLYYGIYLYYGHSLNGMGLDVLSVGNEVRIVGTVQYYEAGGTYQVSDLNYRMINPQDPGNIQKLSEGHFASFRITDPETFVNGQVTVAGEEGEIVLPYAEAVMGTSVEMRDLKVVDIYTTENEDSSSFGAMTLICEAGGVTVTIRTAVFKDEAGNLMTADAYLGKTIHVKGFVDLFDGQYQIKVFTPKYITIMN